MGGCGETPGPAAATAAKKPTVPVVVAAAEIKDLPRVVNGIGQIVASSMVIVRPQITGLLTTVEFSEGQTVIAGQRLFTIDAQVQRDALRQAQAQKARSQAALQQAQAVLVRDQVLLANAELQNGRYMILQEQKVVAEDAAAQYATNVKALQSLLLVDQAAIATAQATLAADDTTIASQTTQLNFSAITAPIAGRVGLVGVTAGNLVTANQTALVTITQTTPIHMVWSVPESWLNDIRECQAKSSLSVMAFTSGAKVPLATGTLEVIDNLIDQTTGTIRLRATFPNQDGRLWPGQAVDLRLILGVDAQALTVPEQAVQTGQKGTYVYVISDEKTAEIRPVQVIRTNDGLAMLGRGLKSGELVVVDGHLRLSPGATVTLAEAKTDAKPGGKTGAAAPNAVVPGSSARP